MKVSLTSRYALLVMAHLAADPCPHTAERLARESGVPQAYIPKVVAPLLRRHLLASQRGLGGGYILACDPGRVSAWDVIVATEGPLLSDVVEQSAIDRMIGAAVCAASQHLRQQSIAALAQQMPCIPS